jgi:hypothetical protein
MRLRTCAIALSLAALCTAPASAIPVTYEFSGLSSGQESLGSYSHNFGVPFFTEMSGQITIESDTAPYYEDASQKNFYDMLLSATAQFGAGGAFGTYTGPGGLQVAPPNGWNSSSMGLSTGFYNDGAPYDQVAIYGSLAVQPGDAANNIYTRFVLWGVSTANVFDTFPSLDQLPDKEAFGPLPMGFDLVSTQYDDAGLWLGQTTLHANLSSFHQVSTAVPEPGTWALFAAGLLAMIAVRRRHRAR